MTDFIEENNINEWKQLIIHNPARLQQEKEVIQKYGSLFHPTNLDNLSSDDFKSFLLIKNNHHWDGIHRQGNIITRDMPRLKSALKILLDENQDLDYRLTTLFPPKGDGYIKGLGRAIVTPLLLVVYPQKYGVWNSKSEAGLQKLGLLPRFKTKDSFADKYIAINQALTELAQKYSLTLWQLDEIVGWIALGNPPISSDSTIPEEISYLTKDVNHEDIEDFGLESHLEDFIIENWDRLDLCNNYRILEEDGDIIGQQYVTPIGRIDILAKGKDNKEWLVIELKKGKTGDQVVGQTLRYISWIREHKAEPGDTVSGLVIAGDKDDKLIYSLKAVPDIRLRTYSVSFKLSEPI